VDAEVALLRSHEMQLAGVVGVGEVHCALALIGNRHGSDDKVEAAGVQRRDDSVPVRGNHRAVGTHFLAQRMGDIQVEAHGLASVVDFIEGGVSTLGADAQLIRCYCLTAEENSGQCRQENCLVAFHRYCSFLWLDMNCLQRSEWGLSNTCSGVPISSTCPWCKNITWL